MSQIVFDISLSPLLPWLAVLPPVLLALALATYGVWQGRRGSLSRVAVVAGIFLALANPSLVRESREYLRDVVTVIIDRSPSQSVARRGILTDEALAGLRAAFERLDDIEFRILETTGSCPEGTCLFDALQRSIADIPGRRLGAAILVTDGQVHDVPATAGLHGAPLHVLLTGEENEHDRRIVLEEIPAYGIVGQSYEIRFRVTDAPDAAGGGVARVTIRRDGRDWRSIEVPVGRTATVSFPVDRAGTSFFELDTPAIPGELDSGNNLLVASVRGVRDRLRVLLVSGEPHPGERAWRDLLKADPSVDLVHFTILRPPEKQDRTPVSELSLISFPVHELFELRLTEFDLVIFDRYRRRGVLLGRYLENIADYVEAGGALLMAVGPDFAGPMSLFHTPLGRVIPAAPNGTTRMAGYRPAITDTGRRHPVTAGLAETADAGTGWGRWFRHIDADPLDGTVLMTGSEDRALLVAARVGEGRVATLLSDHVWLWSRGFEGGGPQAELLRRTAHWLMQEPDLEENSLRAEFRGDRLEIRRQSLEETNGAVTVTGPSGREATVSLVEQSGGVATGSVPVGEAGLYTVSWDQLRTFAIAGAGGTAEMSELVSTDAILGPLTVDTGGGVFRLTRDGLPTLRPVRDGAALHGGSDAGGRGWMGIRSANDFVVTGVTRTPLLPPVPLLVFALGCLLLAWWRESRQAP